MKRLVTLSALTLTLGLSAGTAALAGSGHSPDPQVMIQRLTEHLDLKKSAAQEMTEILLAAHQDGEAVRAAVKSEARALKEALNAGDEQGMLDAMSELSAIKTEATALKEETATAVKSLLTVEQQAKLALHHMHKRHLAETALRDRRQGLE